MDNSMTTWIIVALLVLLIGAAIFMLLRRPGGDDSLDGRDAPAVERDRRDDPDGRTAPEQAQAVAPGSEPARDDAPFDQSSYDTGGATPVAEPGEDRTDDLAGRSTDRAEDQYPADDFLGVEHTDRDEVSTDPAFQDPRTEGHVLAEDSADHDLADRHPDDGAVRDAADRDQVDHDEVRHDGSFGAPASEGYAAAPAAAGYQADPASEGYDAPAADEQAHEQHRSHDDEPLTADEVLASRGVANDDVGDGYAAAGDGGAGHGRHDDGSDQLTDEQPHDEHRDRQPDGAGSGGTSAGAAAAGGAVFAESVYGPGSVEPAEDGSGPEGWEVKGNTGSMLFHTTDSPSYDAVRAEVWFDSEEAARNAGFAHWDRRRR